MGYGEVDRWRTKREKREMERGDGGECKEKQKKGMKARRGPERWRREEGEMRTQEREEGEISDGVENRRWGREEAEIRK